MPEKRITRRTLASYAAALGRNSLAAADLVQFDGLRAAKKKPQILMGNNGFRIVLPEPKKGAK